MVTTEHNDALCKGKVLRTLAVATVMVAAVLVAATGTAGAVDDISSCRTINASNAPADGLVNLTAPIMDSTVAPCINITVSDVTLDGQGNRVDGVDQTVYGEEGVNVTGPVTNVTIQNLTVTDFSDGIVAIALNQDSAIRDVNVTSNTGDGLSLTNSGFSLSSNVSATGVDAFRNGENGVYVSASPVELRMVNASNNLNNGILVTFGNSQNTVVADTVARGNDGHGVKVGSTTSAAVENVTASNVTSVGNAEGAVEVGDVSGEDDSTLFVDGLNIGSSTASDTTIDLGARHVNLSAAAAAPGDPANEQNISRFLNVSRPSTAPDGFLNVTFQYNDSDVSSVDESRLDIWRYNSSNAAWVEKGSGPGTDASKNTISINTTSYSSSTALATNTFAPLANTTAAGGELDNIDSCTTIDASNRPSDGLVRLTDDITNSVVGSCINVTVSDVVLEGQGHTVNGVNSTFDSIGVDVFNSSTTLTNVTVRNLTVTNWEDGVLYLGADDGNITDVNASENGDIGIRLRFSDDNNVSSNDVTRSKSSGIRIDDSDNNTVMSNDVRGFGGIDDGIFLTRDSNNNTVASNDLSGNGGDGIGLFDSSGNNFINNTARNNGNEFRIRESPNNVVENLDIGASTAPNTTVDFTANNVRLSGASSPPADPSGEQNIGRFVDATNTSASGSFLNITFEYTDSDVSGVNESTLELQRFAGTQWVTVAGSSVDTTNNVVSANVTDFSDFGVFGESDGTTNPFFDTSGNPLPRRTVINRVIEWNMNGSIDGTPFTRREIINFVVQWNLAR